MQWTVFDKYTGASLISFTLQDTSHFDAIINKAVGAFKTFRQFNAYQRRNILLGASQKIEEAKQELGILIAKESGKPLKYALGEVDRAAYSFRCAAEEVSRWQGEYLRLDSFNESLNKEALVKYFPAGIVYAITPFNFPLNLVAHKIAPAIAVGCPVLLKPDLRTPLSAIELYKILTDSGLPDGMCQILLLDNVMAEKLLHRPEIRILSFTGSARVGWYLKSIAGKKKTLLELGGNAAVIITPSARVGDIIPLLVTGAFAYSGQVCIHTQRMLIHETVYEVLKNKLTEATSRLREGNPCDMTTDISVMIDEVNIVRVEQWVQEAIEKGATCLIGGKRKGHFFEPTIMENVPHECSLYCEEVFGPVVILEKYTQLEEAIDRVNATRYGLQAGIFSNHLDEILYAFEHIECGGIIVNDVPTFRADNMPYGGIKDSGMGREGIRYAMLEYGEPRVLVWNKSSVIQTSGS